MSDRSDSTTDTAARRFPRAFSARGGGMAIAAMLAGSGAFFVWQAALLDLGTLQLPGPGLFPLLLGVAIIGFAAVVGVECWRSPQGEAIELGHRDVAIAVAALLGVPVLFEPLGAYITLGLFGTVMLVFIARVRVLPAIAAAAVGMAACWYFFQQLLGLQLPTGAW
jgi:putative tricarboxylic transport membrane protein